MEVTVIGYQLRRTASLATAAALLAVTAVAGPAAAADTRNVDIGETINCDITQQDPNGSLTLTPVSGGALTEFAFSWENCGTQSLSNAILTVGTMPATGFNHLADPFSDGTTFFDFFSTGSANSAKACSLNSAKTLLTCNYKSLRALETGDLTVVLTASTSAGSVDAYAAIKVNENTNDGGSNQDTFEATGSTAINAASCDAVQTFLYAHSPKASTCGVKPGNPQSADIGYDGQGAIDLSESPTDNSCDAGGKAPVGSDVVANIDGDTTANTVSWTIVIDLKALNLNSVKASDVVVCHWNDAGIQTAVQNLQATKSGKGILTITFSTAGNGSSRTYG